MSASSASPGDDELDMLRSIYCGAPEEIRSQPDSCRHSISIVVRGANGADHAAPPPPPPPLTLDFWWGESYPSAAPPSCALAAPWMTRRAAVDRIRKELVALWDAKRDLVMYDWIEWLRENAFSFADPSSAADATASASDGSDGDALDSLPTCPCPFILHGEPLLDRKSRFVAHLARVRSAAEVDAVVHSLRADARIAAAAHPTIFAHRLGDPPRDQRDDDGEDGAAERLLFLLRKLELTDVVVVVTRWWGGIMLGPDRFKRTLRNVFEISVFSPPSYCLVGSI